ncbi:LysE family translocator [Mesorhizobium sp. B1-1-8]|uniref:LysE family translocator n=1 Tax=Mesorhizobium sp. B1-1-8 TaxID=2589976 RepID=UPI001128870D|nr:LysE family translocator [Mesorhizobium sp. B1-1-8]UCI06925.1 LysE family translocator [Mesorhizobium sp. B1-1-8]
MTLFLAFLGVSLVVIMTPGPDTAITIRNTLLGGRSAGLFTALGIASGLSIWALATSAGIVALLTASEPLFLAIKYAGAAYLIYLGAQALREAFRPSAIPHPQTAKVPQARLASGAAYRQGLVSDLSNPKIAVFFPSLLPQFVPAGEATFLSLLLLGITFALTTFAWLVFYAAVVAKAGDWLRQPSVRRVVEGITGTLLIGLGLRIATEHR